MLGSESCPAADRRYFSSVFQEKEDSLACIARGPWGEKFSVLAEKITGSLRFEL